MLSETWWAWMGVWSVAVFLGYIAWDLLKVLRTPIDDDHPNRTLLMIMRIPLFVVIVGIIALAGVMLWDFNYNTMGG